MRPRAIRASSSSSHLPSPSLGRRRPILLRSHDESDSEEEAPDRKGRKRPLEDLDYFTSDEELEEEEQGGGREEEAPDRKRRKFLVADLDSCPSDEEIDQVVLEEDETGGGGEEEDRSDSEKKPQPVSSVVSAERSKGKGKGNVSGSVGITIKKTCKVCKGTGHRAGFQGATYVDCPRKPCFLCKLPGHTTMSCPHRVAMEHGVVPSPCRRSMLTSLDYVFHRQLRAGRTPKVKPAFVIPNRVNCGVIRFHSRRVTCLEFHPTRSGVLLSGDKKGQLGIWDYEKLHEKTIYGSIHSCILNNMRFNSQNDGILFTSSSDGTFCSVDLDTGISSVLMDLNPDGWNGPTNWRMLYGLDVNQERGMVLMSDNFGSLYMVDTRSSKQIGKSVLIHKKGTKVVGLHCNPLQPDILVSCGNDHFARIWDTRWLEDGSSLGNLAHGRVVNSAYFSPVTGSKILSTSQDNRIRVWDNIFQDLQCPSREIIHSHDFNRHLTPFRAEWDPKDPSESLAVIGRYISENINGVALHPIDFLDTATGQLVAEVTEPEISTISPVNKLHPTENILASGSSRSVFIWKPQEEDSSEVPQKDHQERSHRFIVGKAIKRGFGGKFDEESDEEKEAGKSSCKRKKLKVGAISSNHKR